MELSPGLLLVVDAPENHLLLVKNLQLFQVFLQQSYKAFCSFVVKGLNLELNQASLVLGTVLYPIVPRPKCLSSLKFGVEKESG